MYALQSAVAFAVPVNLEATLTVLDLVPAVAVLEELPRNHVEELRIFKEYKNVEKTCNQIITKLVPDIYFHTLKNSYTGYMNSSCLEILSHLWTEYGTLSDLQIKKSNTNMKKSQATHMLRSSPKKLKTLKKWWQFRIRTLMNKSF